MTAEFHLVSVSVESVVLAVAPSVGNGTILLLFCTHCSVLYSCLCSWSLGVGEGERERESQREREGNRQRQTDKEKEYVFVCVRVRVKEGWGKESSLRWPGNKILLDITSLVVGTCT